MDLRLITKMADGAVSANSPQTRMSRRREAPSSIMAPTT